MELFVGANWFLWFQGQRKKSSIKLLARNLKQLPHPNTGCSSLAFRSPFDEKWFGGNKTIHIWGDICYFYLLLIIKCQRKSCIIRNNNSPLITYFFFPTSDFQQHVIFHKYGGEHAHSQACATFYITIYQEFQIDILVQIIISYQFAMCLKIPVIFQE